MPLIHSRLNTASSEFTQKLERYTALCESLETAKQSAQFPESEDYLKRQKQIEALTCNERIEALIDANSGILEIAPLCGMDLYEGTPPGAGVRTLIARVAGRECVIVANNSAVKGGSYYPMSVKKHLRAQEIAANNRLPCIYLVDSGGAFLPLQSEVFPDKEHFGRIFYNQANMSKAGIPQISVVLGSCTAGGAYVPAMSDMVIIVREQGTIFLGGPPLVKAATGEEISAEELGGAQVHTEISGVADVMVDSDLEALQAAREHLANLSETRLSSPQFNPLPRNSTFSPPLYPQEEIGGIVGTDLKQSFEIREVLARLLDGSQFEEFKAGYGKTLCCGFGSIYGYQLGIVANDGILFSESALKGAQFIQLCSQRNIPLLFLQNIVGFMVGKDYEHEGIAKHGAKMVTAVACARVPKFTLIIGGSFGAGNYSMCGRAYDPQFLFAWPNSRISVMGGTQAAAVLSEVKRASAKRKGDSIDETEMERFKSEVSNRYDQQGSPYFASARLWDDGIITPTQTRETLALCFTACTYDSSQNNAYGIFRM